MQGKCLCGAVEISTADQKRVSACHCGMCLRWGGGPLLAVHVSGEAELKGTELKGTELKGTELKGTGLKGVELKGAEQVKTFASSEWAERAFCAQCGTHLYYRLLPTNDYILSAGLFPDMAFALEEQIFIDCKPGWYAFANDTEELTEAQVFAKYVPG